MDIIKVPNRKTGSVFIIKEQTEEEKERIDRRIRLSESIWNPDKTLGIRQQMEEVNTYQYKSFTKEFLDDIYKSFFSGKPLVEDKFRHVVIYEL